MRLKLEHHFANEGKDEPIVITIPKGRYLPVFETRFEKQVILQSSPHRSGAGLAVYSDSGRVPWCSDSRLFGQATVVQVDFSRSTRFRCSRRLGLLPGTERGGLASRSEPIGLAPRAGEVRIAAGHTGAPYVDVWGRRWEADRYYEGGAVQPGPRHFFPHVADDGPFKTMREAISADLSAPQSQRQFRYDIPMRSGVYELRLYFADSLRQPDSDQNEDAQNTAIFR